MLCRNWLQPVLREAVGGGGRGGGGGTWGRGSSYRCCGPGHPSGQAPAPPSRTPDLVKSHLMYAVREEVEVLKEQIKELIEKNSQLEQENNLLKTLASPEQLAQFQAQLQTGSPPATTQPQGTTQPPAQPASQGSGPTA
uniref:TSC22 domain family protein 1 n=1 Tax=Suricata suricatta TaxID=37032 RepID=A0A673T247_SURSU